MKRQYRALGAITLIVLAMLALIPGRSLRSQVARARFVTCCVLEIKRISALSALNTSENFIQTLQERPHVIGLATWPYVNSLWTISQRFASLQAHYTELEDFPALQVGTQERVLVSNLGDTLPGLTVAIDRPDWFMREGELTINLFKEDFRAYSLAFNVGRSDGQRVLFVGCIQGRQVDGAKQLYRDMTKKLHGWRPRDLMVSLAQMVGSAVDASKIFLVSDAARVHRHKYFGEKHESVVSANYDEIWSEHGAVPGEGGFYELSTRVHRREPHEILSKKAAMYRRRYQLMALLESDVKAMVRARAVFPLAQPGAGQVAV